MFTMSIIIYLSELMGIGIISTAVQLAIVRVLGNIGDYLERMMIEHD